MRKSTFGKSLRRYIDGFWGWKYRNHALATLFFILWTGFLSPNTIGTQIKAARELRDLKRIKAYYLQDIQYNEAQINRLLSEPAFVEKYGRETYLMKRENEDIYLFE